MRSGVLTSISSRQRNAIIARSLDFIICLRFVSLWSIPKWPMMNQNGLTKTAHDGPAHKFLMGPKRPTTRSKTDYSYIQNGPRTKTAQKSSHSCSYKAHLRKSRRPVERTMMATTMMATAMMAKNDVSDGHRVDNDGHIAVAVIFCGDHCLWPSLSNPDPFRRLIIIPLRPVAGVAASDRRRRTADRRCSLEAGPCHTQSGRHISCRESCEWYSCRSSSAHCDSTSHSSS